MHDTDKKKGKEIIVFVVNMLIVLWLDWFSKIFKMLVGRNLKKNKNKIKRVE